MNEIDEKDLLLILAKLKKNNVLDDWLKFQQAVIRYLKLEFDQPTSDQILGILMQFVNNENAAIENVYKVISEDEMSVLIAAFWTYLDMIINKVEK